MVGFPSSDSHECQAGEPTTLPFSIFRGIPEGRVTSSRIPHIPAGCGWEQGGHRRGGGGGEGPQHLPRWPGGRSCSDHPQHRGRVTVPPAPRLRRRTQGPGAESAHCPHLHLHPRSRAGALVLPFHPLWDPSFSSPRSSFVKHTNTHCLGPHVSMTWSRAGQSRPLG